MHMRLWRLVKTTHWRAALAELVLVVAGVLIALAVDSMQNDGLGLLRNDSLRFHIIAYAATITSSQEVLRHTEAQTWRNSERADLGWWRNMTQPSGGKRWRQDVDVGTFLQDPEILNTFTMQRTVGENRLWTLRGLREPVSTLRRMLERELRVPGTAARGTPPSPPRS